MSAMQPTKRIGEILVDQGLITRNQLDRALERQRVSKEFLGAILIQLVAIRPEVLQSALSEQFQIPQEPLTVERVDWAVTKQFPASIFSAGKCFPFRVDDDSVTVAIANPLDAWALSAVEELSGFRKVKPVLVTDRELQAVLQAYRQRLLRDLGATWRDEH